MRQIGRFRTGYPTRGKTESACVALMQLWAVFVVWLPSTAATAEWASAIMTAATSVVAQMLRQLSQARERVPTQPFESDSTTTQEVPSACEPLGGQKARRALAGWQLDATPDLSVARYARIGTRPHRR